MASPIRTLTVNLVGRTENLDKAFKRVSKGSSLMSDKIGRATRHAGVAFGAIGGAAIGAAAALKPMIDMAGDIQESLSKNVVVFGQAADGVAAFADTAATKLGMSRQQALEATGQFGALAAAMKLPQEQGAKMATTLTALAADMASFNNASPEETLLALQSGLRGEAEPLRRFGVLLDAATLKARALKDGLIENESKALTPVQKALAAYSVILEQTSVQQGDFERTSDGLANQQRILASNFDNLQASVGEALLPALESLVTFMNDNVIPALGGFMDAPSVTSAGKATGEIWGNAFQDGLSASVPESAGGQMGFIDSLIAVGTNPLAQAAMWIGLGIDFTDGFIAGVEEANFAERLAAIIERTGGHGPNFPRGGGGGGGASAPAGSGHPASPGASPSAGGPDWDRSGEGSSGGSGSGSGTGAGRVPGGFGVDTAAAAAAAAAAEAAVRAEAQAAMEAAAAAAKAAEEQAALDRFLAVVGTPDWNAFTAAQAHGGPPNTQVNVVVNGVSGQEVVDAIGQHVDTNGALPDWWTQ